MKNTHTDTVLPGLSRRSFLGAGSGLAFSAVLGAPSATAQASDALRPNAWVIVGTDNIVTILAPVAEMGQGTLTALPLIVAEELDADWQRVRTEYAPPTPAYANPYPLLGGLQASVASVAVLGYFTPLRIAGAQARRVLMQAAASQWGVPLNEVSTEVGQVVHAGSGRRLSYGEIARFAQVPAQLPQVLPSELKRPDQYRLLGKSGIGRSDVPAKVTGAAKYGIDVQIPDMLYASVLESPMDGARPDVVNRDEALAVPGITHVMPMPFGVAVVGTTVEATRTARHVLKAKVTWNTSAAAAASYDSQQARQDFARAGQDPAAKTMVAYGRGDAAAGFAEGTRVLEASYATEHAYHAQMEPMNCTARVAEDGQSAEIWLGTQTIAGATGAAAGFLKTTPNRIRVHQQLLGGGYGRRMAPDVLVQTLAIAKATGKPVKLILTREDDMAAARPRPLTHHVLRAALDGQGRITGWRHRLVAENVDALAAPPRYQATGGRDYIGWQGCDLPHYAIAHYSAEAVRETRGIRVQPFRGVGSGYNKFAIESFLDEVAHARRMDPLALRLELTRQDARATAVLQAVAEMAQWKRPRRGRALGLALADYHGTLSAGVAEISLDRASGKIKVHEYWLAVDPGLVIQPDNVLAQAEGSVAWGLSVALLEQLDIRAGVVQQSNFNDYPVLRMSEMPEVHVRIVPSDAAPTGMGEVGVGAVAPAIANALFSLTGRRVRQLPMSPPAVKAALAQPAARPQA